MSELSVVLVDDEPPARERLRRLLGEHADVRVGGEAGSGLEAVELSEAERPDVVLLDIQMPELDGFGVIEALDPTVVPQVIFVTAYDEHALRAFEVHALDDLLKPVEPERLRVALGRAMERRPDSPSAAAILGALPTSGRKLERFLVRLRSSMTLIPVTEVDWIGAAGNYVELHVGRDVHLVRGTLQELEDRLPERFVRIHRSAIVNLDRVRKLEPWSHGDWMVQLSDGTELRLSRRYRGRLSGVFGS